MEFKCLANPDNKNIDVIISTVPWTDSALPLMAPGVLKPIVEKTGATCLAIDLNVEVYEAIKALENKSTVINFFFDGVVDAESEDWVRQLHIDMAQQMLAWNPKFIGLSVFSYIGQHSTEWLCYYLKQMAPTVKIMLGGAGCLEQFTGPSTFAEGLINRGLADYHIRGDGENALFELLTGNDSYIGINSNEWKELDRDELSKLPYPDYSDYEFSFYEIPALPLQGSRGCVRKCTFCDYIANWTKFQWRTADDIFQEMLLQHEKYGIRRFKFQDTLTNGNLKEFNRLIEQLAEHNEKYPDQRFTWSGYYIFREKAANDDHMWEILAKSGASVLVVGIENLNQDIRYDIGKKFSNDSIDYHLSQAQKHRVKLQLLMITGYVNETREHIEFSKRWLDDHVQYIDTIASLQWGGGLGIFPNTYLDKNKDALGIKMIGPKPHLWVNEHTGSTPVVRAGWVKELNEHSRNLGYRVQDNLDNHFLLEQILKNES